MVTRVLYIGLFSNVMLATALWGAETAVPTPAPNPPQVAVKTI
ncbi:MAG: hypothetical protein WCJ97_08905 [Phycisphaerae bacterium]